MKRFVFLICFILILGCVDNKINQQDLHHLNGYWEIQKVEFPNGQIKEYQANTVIDFIHFKEGKGMRKKVQPKLDGSYTVFDDEESFEVIEANSEFSIYYKSTLSERQERLTALDSLSFATQNEEGIVYFYTRFQPISIQL